MIPVSIISKIYWVIFISIFNWILYSSDSSLEIDMNVLAGIIISNFSFNCYANFLIS